MVDVRGQRHLATIGDVRIAISSTVEAGERTHSARALSGRTGRVHAAVVAHAAVLCVISEVDFTAVRGVAIAVASGRFAVQAAKSSATAAGTAGYRVAANTAHATVCVIGLQARLAPIAKVCVAVCKPVCTDKLARSIHTCGARVGCTIAGVSARAAVFGISREVEAVVDDTITVVVHFVAGFRCGTQPSDGMTSGGVHHTTSSGFKLAVATKQPCRGERKARVRAKRHGVKNRRLP